jgi:hypothetical protein
MTIDVEQSNIEFLHIANRKYLIEESSKLAAKDEVKFNILRKISKPSKSQKKDIFRNIVSTIFVLCVLIIPGSIMLFTALQSAFNVITEGKASFTTMFPLFCLVPISIVLLYGGIKGVRQNLSYLETKDFAEDYLNYLLNSGQFFVGEVISVKPSIIKIADKDQQVVNISYRFVGSDKSTFFGTYTKFGDTTLNQESNLLILYHTPFLHLPL